MEITYQKPYYKVTGFNRHILYWIAKRYFKKPKIASFIMKEIGPFSDKWSFRIHRFFIPELVYMLKLCGNVACRKLVNLIETQTWYSNVLAYQNGHVKIRTDLHEIALQMNCKLKNYQKDFILSYNKKEIYNLNGYLLAFEQGLGKTLTGLALMTSLKKKSVIIICPKSTMINVWKHHIETFYKKQKKIWICHYQEKDVKDCDFYIVNYESMSKLNDIPINKNCGIIVDESHNFLHANANRTVNLMYLAKKLECKDVLMMSGTPLKAIGIEMLPMLKILDLMFDDAAMKIFVQSFGLNTDYASKIFHNRLGIFMYRKLKEEVLNLPKKNELTIKVKIPNANKYTLDAVKTKVIDFYHERKKHYDKNMKQYIEMYEECIKYLDTVIPKDDKDYIEYKKNIFIIRYNVNSPGDLKTYSEIVHKTLVYEDKVLYPMLPNDLKKKFKASKSVVKYVFLKIFGEIIGGLLVHLRDEMCQQMIKFGNIQNIITSAEKKTILFTSYRNCAYLAKDFYEKLSFKPAIITGENSTNCTEIIKEFKENKDINPLIATIQTLSTGVTITEANTIVFLNKPWRFIEYQQASDRIHRIGQDTDVYIYTLVLDTGNRPNLSTRMEEIEQWSKEMFKAIVDDMTPKTQMMISNMFNKIRF